MLLSINKNNLDENIIKFYSIIISFLPIALITGPFVSELIINLCSIMFLYLSIKNKEFHYFKNYFFYFIIFWNIYLLFLSITSDYILLSLESSLFYIRFGIFAISIWFILSKNERVFHYFFYTFTFAFLILFLDGFFQYFMGYNIFGFEYKGYRLSSFFGEEKKLGSYLSRLMPVFFGIALYIYRSNSKIIIFTGIVFIITDILVYLSGERSAFFNLILFIICLIFLSSYSFRRLITFAISLIIIILISFSSENIRDRMIDKTIKQTSIFGETKNIFSIQHQVIYISAFRIFNDNKFFGIGPKNFRKECNKPEYQVLIKEDASVNGCQTHPHNTYVQLLSETGIIGTVPIFLIFVFINFIFIKKLFFKFLNKTNRYEDSKLCFFIALYISLWPIIPTGNFFNNWLSIIYYLPIGFILFIQYKVK